MIPTARSADHFGYVVPELDEAVAFFVEVLGAEEVFRIHRIADLTGKVGVHPGASVRGAMLRFGAASNVELLEYRSPDQAEEPPLVSDPGAGHLAVYVEDMDAAAAYVRALPTVPWFGEAGSVPDDQPHGGLVNFFFTAPWGLLIELVSYGTLPYERTTTARMWGPAMAWTNRPGGDGSGGSP